MHEQYRRLTAADFPALSALHRAYKEAIGEAAPTEAELSRLRGAMDRGDILFFGCETEGSLVGVCSVTRGFSTYDYRPSGVLDCPATGALCPGGKRREQPDGGLRAL